MSPDSSVDLRTPRVRWATRIGFFIAGFGLSVWAPLVPYVRERIPMSDATFGLLLLFVGAGSLICMPLSGMFAARFGIRRAALAAMGLLALVLAVMALTDSIVWLAIALFGFEIGRAACRGREWNLVELSESKKLAHMKERITS